MKTIYLAGGCFWGVQKYLSLIQGVISTSAARNLPKRERLYKGQPLCNDERFYKAAGCVF
jgi:peptide methionine sulfoxide reductase MsrA